jgi:hypothetical protein
MGFGRSADDGGLRLPSVESQLIVFEFFIN